MLPGSLALPPRLTSKWPVLSLPSCRLPTGAIATEAQLDALLESVVERVVIGKGQSRDDPPTELDVAVDGMVLLLAREAVARARPGLVAAMHGARGS